MSQPPGQYGGQYGQPGQYGPPGQYGQPAPGQYGQPGGYGPPGGPGFGPGGYGQPPQKKSVLPWVITAAVVVLAGVGVLLFFLLKDDDDGGSTTASTSTSASVSTSSSAEQMGAEEMGGTEVDPDEDLPTGANVPMDDMDDDNGGGSGDSGEEFPGSIELAATFLQLLVDGDGDTALSLAGADLTAVIEELAAGEGLPPGEYLYRRFYASIGDAAPEAAELLAVEYDSASDLEAISIGISTAAGDFEIVVYVGEDLLVEDLGLP